MKLLDHKLYSLPEHLSSTMDFSGVRVILNLKCSVNNLEKYCYRVHNTKKNATKYTQANTNNINKTWILLPTTRDKDELNTVFMLK
jgi:hypothetical protein